MKLQAGQQVADIGAGTGLFEVPLAIAVGPTGRIYAEDIDAGFFPIIRKRAADAKLTNVETVLGGFTDPKLPVKNIDIVLIHDVMHHIEKRPDFIKTLTGYLAPSGRIVVVDYEAGKGPHPDQPELQVSRQSLTGWMSDAGLTQVGDVKLFPDKYLPDLRATAGGEVVARLTRSTRVHTSGSNFRRFTIRMPFPRESVTNSHSPSDPFSTNAVGLIGISGRSAFGSRPPSS